MSDNDCVAISETGEMRSQSAKASVLYTKFSEISPASLNSDDFYDMLIIDA
jgi:hypothetical protein